MQGSSGALEGCSQTAASEKPPGRVQDGFMLRQIPQELSLKCAPDSVLAPGLMNIRAHPTGLQGSWELLSATLGMPKQCLPLASECFYPSRRGSGFALKFEWLQIGMMALIPQ